VLGSSPSRATEGLRWRARRISRQPRGAHTIRDRDPRWGPVGDLAAESTGSAGAGAYRVRGARTLAGISTVRCGRMVDSAEQRTRWRTLERPGRGVLYIAEIVRRGWRVHESRGASGRARRALERRPVVDPDDAGVRSSGRQRTLRRLVPFGE